MIEAIIEAEADRLARHTRGATERDDLVGYGWLAYLTASRLTMGGLRLRIRGAMKDALRREWRALGRVNRAIYWPIYWPKHPHQAPGGQLVRQRIFRIRRCRDCPMEIPSTRQRCQSCAAQRRLENQRRYNQAYYHREAS